MIVSLVVLVENITREFLFSEKELLFYFFVTKKLFLSSTRCNYLVILYLVLVIVGSGDMTEALLRLQTVVLALLIDLVEKVRGIVNRLGLQRTRVNAIAGLDTALRLKGVQSLVTDRLVLLAVKKLVEAVLDLTLFI